LRVINGAEQSEFFATKPDVAQAIPRGSLSHFQGDRKNEALSNMPAP
jgi:hypothetical protein